MAGGRCSSGSPAGVLLTHLPVITRRIKRITPLQLGKILAVLYGAMGLLAAPVFLLLVLAGSASGQNTALPAVLVGVVGAVLAPILYAVLGFLIGVIGAFLYNLIARWVGGIEVEVE